MASVLGTRLGLMYVKNYNYKLPLLFSFFKGANIHVIIKRKRSTCIRTIESHTYTSPCI